MPLPILPILAGLGSAIGAGAGAYGLGTSIKDRNAQKRREKDLANARKKAQSAITSGKNLNAAGFTPSAQPSSFWGGQPAGVETFNQYTPEQQQALSQVLQQALGGIGRNQFDFAPIEAQARKGFAEQTIPGIAERFTSLGSGGSQGSSAFAQQLGAAGAGLETDLASMKQNYNLAQQQMLHNLLGIGLRPQFESLYRPGSEGFGKAFAKDLLGNLLNAGNLQGALGGAKGAINALKDWRNKKQVNQAFANADAVYNAQNQPQFNPVNPANFVAGVKAPGIPQVPQVGAGGKIGGIAALKGLYGL